MRIKQKVIGWFFAVSILSVFFSPPVQALISAPEQIVLVPGQRHTLDLKLPYMLEINGKNIAVLSSDGQSIEDIQQSYVNQPLEIEPIDTGSMELSFSLWGLPVKTISIQVLDGRTVQAGGESIGISLWMQGAMVAGFSDVVDGSGKKGNPALDAGLQVGDVILKINGEAIKSSEHLAELVQNSPDGKVIVEYSRENQTQTQEVSTMVSSYDKQYKLGVWVRDSTAGIGTLSFIDPATNRYAALGHGITDSQSGVYLPVNRGEITPCFITGVVIGVNGRPGELQGTFDSRSAKIGNIEHNTPYGIFGASGQSPADRLMMVGYRHGVHTGEASILVTVDGGGVKEYQCKIIKVNHQSQPGQKSMVIQITDPALIKATGGIVQGMSGSPIIQDNKMIGCVTHVFLDDPTKGYGVFIDWMLQISDK